MFLAAKRSITLLILPLFMAANLHAAYFSYQPYRITQPDKSVINCYVSGDEYFNWIHDRNGYTLIQASDGYYYYAVKASGILKPGHFIAGTVNPEDAGLTPWAKISDQDYQQRHSAFQAGAGQSATAPTGGTLNNLVVYIRFAGDAEFSTSRLSYDNLFNLSPGESLKSYYSEVSYNQLNINSTHYPECATSTNLSYQDFHPRAYYEPYNATANTIGYTDDGDRIYREHTLLKNAVEWIEINSPVPSGLNIDEDNDGNVDNVSFIIKGTCSAWSQLLWSHNWQLFSFNVLLNGKRVWQYTFEPESQADVKTLCHEMFHSLGAPDLYHYNSDGVQPVGAWDLMEDGSGHMGAWMKYKYSQHTWINSIPVISASGIYTLNPLETQGNNCYRIASPNSTTEFFVIEYRKAEGQFEGNLPGSGLLVYRIDTLANGNATGPPDEVYIYRPNGTRTINGSPSNAFFAVESGRTSINDGSNPGCFLQDGEAGGLQVFDIGTAGSTISFSVYINQIESPSGFKATASGPREIHLNWQKNIENDNVLVVYNTTSTFGSPVNGASFDAGTTLPGGGIVLYNGSGEEFIHSDLNNNTTYFYRIYSVTAGMDYSNAMDGNATTLCGSYSLPFTENFNSAGIPDCWTMQHTGCSAIDNWDVTTSNIAGGTGNELRSTFQQVNPGITRIVTPMINTIGMAKLNLSFRTTLDDWAPGATLRIQSSADGQNWTNEAWSLSTHSNTMVGPMIINTTITQNLDSPHTYIAFSIEGDLYKYDFWYIDDVFVTIASVLPVQLTVSGNPPEAGTVSGSGTYLFGQMVTLSATPNPVWDFLYWTENGTIVSNDANFIIPAATRNLIANFSATEANVVASSYPETGGITQGAGIYELGAVATLHALANEGYEFSGWTYSGNQVSGSSIYSFPVTGSNHLVAQFSPVQIQSYTVSVEASPQEGGLISGGRTCIAGEGCTVYASPYAGWIFEAWKENGVLVSYRPIYSFPVTADHTLEAVFRQEISVYTASNPPEAGQVLGGGSFYTGDSVTCKALGNKGWTFNKWTLNGVEVSTDTVYSFAATMNCSLKAVFITGVGIPESDIAELSLYPNPGKGLIHIDYPGDDPLVAVKIFTVSGQLAKHSSLSPAGNPYTFDLSGLPPGQYMACLTARSGIQIKHKILIINH